MKYQLVESRTENHDIKVYQNYQNKGIGMKIVDYNKVFEEKIKEGRDFKIDTTVDYDAYITSGKVVDPSDDIYMKRSIYSYKYGIKSRDSMESIPYKYRCRCTKTYGKIYEGALCEHCNTIVEEIKDNIETVGWMMIPPILGKIPSPIGLSLLMKILGEATFRRLMKMNAKRKKKKKGDEDKKKKATPKAPLPFMCELSDKNKMRQFLSKYRNKKDLVDLFMKNFDSIYSNVYPVITEKVRSPIVKVENGIPRMSVPDISGRYTVISTLINDVNHEGVIHTLKRKNALYTKLLQHMHKVDAIIVEHLGGSKVGQSKSKFIRGLLLGGRIPYSGRAVIVPSPATELKDITIPAIIFKRLFKTELQEILISMEYDMHEIIDILNREHIQDDAEFTLIKECLKRLEPHVLINRQPSLNVSNILSFRVKDIVDNFNIYMNPATCGLLNADFDKVETVMILGKYNLVSVKCSLKAGNC